MQVTADLGVVGDRTGILHGFMKMDSPTTYMQMTVSVMGRTYRHYYFTPESAPTLWSLAIFLLDYPLIGIHTHQNRIMVPGTVSYSSLGEVVNFKPDFDAVWDGEGTPDCKGVLASYLVMKA